MEIVLVLLTPILGKLAQKIVDQLKRLNAFGSSHRYVKQVVAFLVSIATAYLGLTGAERFTDLVVGDITGALVALATFILSMQFHDSRKIEQIPSEARRGFSR